MTHVHQILVGWESLEINAPELDQLCNMPSLRARVVTTSAAEYVTKRCSSEDGVEPYGWRRSLAELFFVIFGNSSLRNKSNVEFDFEGKTFSASIAGDEPGLAGLSISCLSEGFDGVSKHDASMVAAVQIKEYLESISYGALYWNSNSESLRDEFPTIVGASKRTIDRIKKMFA